MLDQLGKPMQIYEIFGPRPQPVREGILGGIATYAQSAIADKLQAAVPGVRGLGAAFAPGGDNVSTGQAQGAATKMTAGVVDQMAKSAQDNYTQGILNLFKAKNVDSVSAVQQDANELILKIVNQNLMGGADYKKIADSVSAQASQGEAKTMAKAATNSIDTAIQVIASDASTADKTNAFKQLAQGTAQLKSLNQFQGGASAGAGAGTGPINTALTKMTQTAAASKLTASQLGIPSNTLSDIQNKIPPGTDPKLDMLFTALGIYKSPGAAK